MSRAPPRGGRLVTARLRGESERLLLDAAVAAEQERAGEKPRESSESLHRKALELEARLEQRLRVLDQQAQMSTKPPIVRAAALVLPVNLVEEDLPADAPIHARETEEVERRGVDKVMACEAALGRDPVEQAHNNKGFDVLSTAPNGDTYRIEVKARIDGAEDFYITHNEVLTGKNAAPLYRLALVRIDPRGADVDEVRYSTTRLPQRSSAVSMRRRCVVTGRGPGPRAARRFDLAGPASKSPLPGRSTRHADSGPSRVKFDAHPPICPAPVVVGA